MKIKSVLGLTFAFTAMGIIMPAQSQAAAGFSQPTYGYELGAEQQLETAFGRDVVERTYGRALATVEWQLYENPRGDTFDLELKGGAFAGKYKGSMKVEDEFGSLTQTRVGVTTEAMGLYTLNAGKADPFLGLSGVVEAVNQNTRAEWQADVVTGVKFQVADDKDLSLMYKKTLAHGMKYYNPERSYRQDDGYLVALIGTKHMPDATTRSIKLAYEFFDVGDMRQEPNGGVSYEPDTRNILVSYSRTF